MLDLNPYLVNRVRRMNAPDYEKILRNWHIKSPVLNDSINLHDCFEPSDIPTIFTDADGAQWILEIISEKDYSRLLAIAETLEQLEKHGCCFIAPYQRNSLGQFITFYSGKLCMVRPHSTGIPLQRDKWLTEEWRADALAGFIINLQRTAQNIRIPENGNPFAIIDFVKRRTETLSRHRPEISESLFPVYTSLERNLFPALCSLPAAFCHGDFKPANIVWGENSIQAVVGWKFCGLKPEAYDAALLVGCIGFEHPDALISDFTKRLIHQLQDASIYTEESWKVFFDLVLASRYSWLAEWMRTHNEKTRDLEMLYMTLLNTQRTYIIKKWNMA